MKRATFSFSFTSLSFLPEAASLLSLLFQQVHRSFVFPQTCRKVKHIVAEQEETSLQFPFILSGRMPFTAVATAIPTCQLRQRFNSLTI